MKHIRIHQFSPATAVGDGVTGGLFFTRKLLRKLGYQSEIYASGIPDALADEVFPMAQFDSNHCDLLLVHHSLGHDHERWLKKLSCPRVMVYHNITPSHFFPENSPERHYSIKGREQLRAWTDLFIGAIGDSPYNSEELLEAGYTNVETLPMLLELDKFGGDEVEPPLECLEPGRPLLLSVGRIAENKRQHLMIEAIWHLKRLWPDSAPRPRLLLVGGTTSPRYEAALKGRIAQLELQEDVLLTGKCSDAELRWLYHHADLYWCASEHEGFCIPLIEAGYFQLPVISFASSNIPATLGEAGLILENSDPLLLAAASQELLRSDELQKKLIAAGSRNLDRFRESTLLPQLQHYLNSLGIPLRLENEAA